MVTTCPENLNFASENDVTWQIPEFRNPVTDAEIIPWCTHGISDPLGPGDHTINCTATNPDNEISTSCVFAITVEGISKKLKDLTILIFFDQ